jgi:hypothetical protein
MDSGKFSYQVLLTLAKHSVEISVLSQIILDVRQLLNVPSHLCNHQIQIKRSIEDMLDCLFIFEMKSGMI